MRILVVDDDQHIRETLGLVLHSLGYEPFPAATVQEALELLSQVKPHVVLLDLLMEGTVSTPFIETSRQLMGEDAPGIIILSAMTGAKAVAEAHHVDFLAKPFDIDQLHKMIEGEIKTPEK